MTNHLVHELEVTREYFERSSRCLTEEDSSFAPVEGTMTAAQVVAHVAQTVDWFLEGAFRPEGFDLDFEAHTRAIEEVASLAAAREWFERAFAQAIEAIGARTDEEMSQPLAEGPIMGGQPRSAIVGAIADHTAHHRGALTIYSRLRGHVPPMPYMEE